MKNGTSNITNKTELINELLGLKQSKAEFIVCFVVTVAFAIFVLATLIMDAADYDLTGVEIVINIIADIVSGGKLKETQTAK